MDSGLLLLNLGYGLMFIALGPASADVRADGQLFFISWGNERLKRVQIENPVHEIHHRSWLTTTC